MSGSELWEDNFSPPLDLVQGYKGYIDDVWELRKAKLYLRTLHSHERAHVLLALPSIMNAAIMHIAH